LPSRLSAQIEYWAEGKPFKRYKSIVFWAKGKPFRRYIRNNEDANHQCNESSSHEAHGDNMLNTKDITGSKSQRETSNNSLISRSDQATPAERKTSDRAAPSPEKQKPQPKEKRRIGLLPARLN